MTTNGRRRRKLLAGVRAGSLASRTMIGADTPPTPGRLGMECRRPTSCHAYSLIQQLGDVELSGGSWTETL